MPPFGEEWFDRAEKSLSFFKNTLVSCCLCPRICGIDRLSGETGYCGGGDGIRVSSAFPHFGEEPPLVGTGGSGTIFLSGCGLKCIFCQNYTLSHMMEGAEIAAGQLAEVMLRLQGLGCHNVNFVTPTHFLPWIVEELIDARRQGLEVPVVYNCGGYESVEMLQLLEGLIEIYMPDFKFWSEDSAGRYCNAPDYPQVARKALREMYRQVGDFLVKDGVAVRGLLVRHLVMPGGVEESREILDFVCNEISGRTYVNIMAQYRPVFRAKDFSEIERLPTENEYREVFSYAKSLGLRIAR